jgi:uncharacterized protein (DUF1501 family)
MDQPDRSVAGRFSRRHFLVGAGSLGAATAAGGLLVSRPWASPTSTSGSPRSLGPLVLVSLYGGNDGLNTVVPHTDPAYRAARPTLGYTSSQVLDIGDGLALNSKLTGLHQLWKSGELAIVRGVGYPNPNLSHFASMAIWQTANVTDGTGSGWLGRWLDRAGDGPLRAISVGVTLPPLLRGEKESASAITGPSIPLPGDHVFQQAYASMQETGQDRTGLAAAVAASGQNLLAVRNQLTSLVSPKAGGSPGRLSAADLSGQLQVVADLIRAGAPTEVYQVSLESFDTHAAEKTNHERLLGQLDTAVAQFFASLRGVVHAEGVVLMTYSEFGRRPAENASGGTDHGTAAPLFVAGPKVKGGRFYGEEPALSSLDSNGNLRYNLDFRQLYATMLDRVLGADPSPVLGGDFKQLAIF